MNNTYNSVSVLSNTPTVVVGLTVPERGGYSLKGAFLFSQIDCYIQVMFNVEQIAGGWITGTVPNLFFDFSASPYGLGPGDVISILATQTSGVTHTVAGTILAEQL